MKQSAETLRKQAKIRRLLAAGIPLAMLIPLAGNAEIPSSRSAGIPPRQERDKIQEPIPVVGRIAIPPHHNVKNGETLSKIAQMYGTDVKTLCKLNNISLKNADKIRPGQIIFIPFRSNKVNEKPDKPLRGKRMRDK